MKTLLFWIAVLAAAVTSGSDDAFAERRVALVGETLPTWPTTCRSPLSHPANEIAVANGQVDLATDYDRNLNSMVERGLLKREAIKVVWTSDPLPNDALVVRNGYDPALTTKLRETVLNISDEQGRSIMPAHYTGWVAATHSSYKVIEDAGIAIGILKSK